MAPGHLTITIIQKLWLRSFYRNELLRGIKMNKTTLIVLLFLTLAGNCHAIGISEEMAIKALIGEAIGQSDEELQAHAYALKNRGTLRGVNGLKATHTPTPTGSQWQRASKAWWTALLDVKDPLDGRTEWRSMH